MFPHTRQTISASLYMHLVMHTPADFIEEDSEDGRFPIRRRGTCDFCNNRFVLHCCLKAQLSSARRTCNVQTTYIYLVKTCHSNINNYRSHIGPMPTTMMQSPSACLHLSLHPATPSRLHHRRGGPGSSLHNTLAETCAFLQTRTGVGTLLL